MEKAKRARKAETPRQPSLRLRLRAPYLYPDPPWEPNWGSPQVSSWKALMPDVREAKGNLSASRCSAPLRGSSTPLPLALWDGQPLVGQLGSPISPIHWGGFHAHQRGASGCGVSCLRAHSFDHW
jgi:hypothetical protein